MKLTPAHIAKIEKLLDRVASDVYPEPPSDLHITITGRMMEMFLTKTALPKGATMLDVGCGSGLALVQFRDRGYPAIGITLGHMDLKVCRDQGFDARMMDQSCQSALNSFQVTASNSFHFVIPI